MTTKEKRPNIGFLTCHLDNDYAMEVCKGVEYAAEEADVNLIIFPGMYMNASYNDPENAKYDYQYNSIFYYANKKSLDALIISVGSIGTFLSVKDKKAFVDSFDIPVLTLEIEVPGYPYLYTEGQTGMRQVLEHIIKDHGKRKVGFVNGRLENADAVERFNVYKKILKENDIPYDEERVAYGDFSEFSEEIVGELLDNNPDLEAIVFANDTMAIGGYKAIQARGKRVGKDILVAGYDNTPASLSLAPQLTTVDNHIMDMGYNSVYQVLELLKTGDTSKSLLHSQMVTRSSCGCDITDNPKIISKIDDNWSKMTSSKLVKYFIDNFMKEYSDSFNSKQLFRVLTPYFKMFANLLFDDKKLTYDMIRQASEKVYNDDIIKYYFSFSKITYTINLYSRFLYHLEHGKERENKLANAFKDALSMLAFRISTEYGLEVKRNQQNVWSSMYVIRDTLLSATDDTKVYKVILEKLYQNTQFNSAYIYLYDEKPVQLTSGMWNIPQYLSLQAYSQEGKVTTLEENNRMLPSYMIFNNKATPNDHRHTMVLTPIFTNEVQHGLFLCEANLGTFNQVYASSLQLGTSLKFITLMKQEYEIQKRLESTMNEIREKNDLLNMKSVTDELTKLYNRRGFFDMSQQIVTNKSNLGNKALIAYIDMDNLKQVNDKFGHKDGDYCLQTIAQILRNSFPKSSILARIGGDEYAAFVPEMSNISIDDIKTNLDYYSDKENETNERPYYIEFSYGFQEFECSDDVNIEVDMMAADKELYINKKGKRKSVLKSDNVE